MHFMLCINSIIIHNTQCIACLFPLLSQEDKEFLDRPLEASKISLALKQFNNQKTPGTDGLPLDFLKVFWARLRDFMYILYLEIIEERNFHLTARQGILSLLEKMDKNILLIKSWCPLTLLNTDNKLLESKYYLMSH